MKSAVKMGIHSVDSVSGPLASTELTVDFNKK